MEDFIPAAGSELLQVGRSRVHLKTSIVCADSKLGKVIPLDDAGFRDVAESCCYDDMKDFIRRLAEQMELQVCSEGGLSGFAPYFSCSNGTLFEYMTTAMKKQTDEQTRCKWLGRVGEECPLMDAACGVSTNPLHKESLVQGYIGLDAENNPPALVTNDKVKGTVKQLISDNLGVPESQVQVEIGTGPVDAISLYQVALKSPKTGKYVEAGPDGNLVASSMVLKTLDAKHSKGNSFLVKGGSNEVLVKWNRDNLSFQTEAGEDALEDEDGHVIWGRDPDRRLEVSFPGFKSVSASYSRTRSLLALQRSCTVVVSYEVLQTEPPTLDAEKIKETAAKMDMEELQTRISNDLAEVEPCVGKLEISTFKYCKEKGSCEDRSLKLAHSDREYNHQGNHVPEDDADSAIKLVVNGTSLANGTGTDIEISS
jgi:hypothetical protein